MELTEAGRSFFERCEFIVSETQDALEGLLKEQRNHTGRIRLALPATTYFAFMQGALSAFTAKYPGIEMHVHFSNRWVDLYAEPYDLEIRSGPLPDSDLIVRKLFTGRQGIYAARELLDHYPVPREPRDLATFPYIHMTIFPRETLDLRKGNQEESIPMRPVHVVNGLALGMEFLLAGQGIAAVELGSAREYEQSGTIVWLLPEWTVRGVDINLVRASGKTSHRVQLFVEHLVEHFAALRQE